MTIRHLVCFLLLIVTLALASCGSTPDTRPGSRRPAVAPAVQALPACSLLTQEEAEAFLGEPVDKPTNSATGNIVSNCNWITPSFKTVGILVRRSGSREEAEDVREIARGQSKSFSGVDPEDLDELGDSAYWAGGRANQLNVFKGNYWLIVTASKGQTSENLALARAVAEKVVARLE